MHFLLNFYSNLLYIPQPTERSLATARGSNKEYIFRRRDWYEELSGG